MTTNNPLSGFYRSPKLYTALPSQGKFYEPDVMDFDPQVGEVPVYAMTARDEMTMKNPDALLNGDAVAQVIRSCVPGVHKPRDLLSCDVDTLLVAIQGASYDDQVEISSQCPQCSNTVVSAVSIDACLQNMSFIGDDLHFDTDSGLTINLRPVTYDTTVKLGITTFQTQRSLQSIANIQDEMEQLHAFNTSYRRMAELNFEILVDTIHSIEFLDDQGEKTVIQNRDHIREFLENCDNSVGKHIVELSDTINNSGVQKTAQVECDSCGHQFPTDINFDPVGFFTAS